jgi:hypothetical protein
MTTIHAPRPLYNALAARISSQTSKPVGDAVRPPNASPPYSVLYPLPDRDTQGALSDPNQISRQLFQVTCVGASMDVAQELQFDVRTALLGHQPVVSGWDTGPIELDFGSGVLRDDDGPVFYSTDRFLVYVS